MQAKNGTIIGVCKVNNKTPSVAAGGVKQNVLILFGRGEWIRTTDLQVLMLLWC